MDQNLRDKFAEEKQALNREIRDLKSRNDELTEYGDKKEQH